MTPATPTNKTSGSGEDELDKILARMSQRIEDGEGVSYDYYGDAYGDKFTLADAKAAIRAYTQRQVLQARYEELSHVQLAYGNYGATTYANDKPQGVEDRILELTQQLNDMEQEEKV